MTVNELYDYSISHEVSTLAHYIFHLFQEKKVTSQDDITKIDFEQADHEKVEAMIKNNELGIYKLRIYGLKMNDQDFVYIFARNVEDAIQLFSKTYHQLPVYWKESDLDTDFVRGKETISFRDMRKEYNSFPAFVGEFSKYGNGNVFNQ